MIAILVSVSALFPSCTGKTRPNFSKGFFYTFAHDGPAIILDMVSADGRHLTGTFGFENISGERKRAKDVVVRGVRRAGAFWAHARCEVRRDENSSWEPIGRSWVLGWPATLNVKAESTTPAEFSVRLDIFDDAINKYRFGRIILSSGDTSQFLLEDLTSGSEKSSNQAMQRTAGRSAFTLSMIQTPPVFATRALARGR